MSVLGRRIAALAAVLAVVVAAIAVYLSTGRSTGVSMASGTKVPAVTAEQLRPMLLTKDDLPEGTEFEDAPIDSANQAVNQDGMVVKPESCLGAVQIALKGAPVTGWLQAGSVPDRSGRIPFQVAVGVADGGLDLAAVRAAVGTCRTGTISWPEHKLTAEVSLAEVTAPGVRGMRTYAYKSTMKFTNVTQEQLAPIVGSCSIARAADTGTVSTVSKECVEHAPVSAKLITISTEQYVGLAVGGSAYVSGCGGTIAAVSQMLAIPSRRLQEAGIVQS